MEAACEHLLFCCLGFVQLLASSCKEFTGRDLLQELWGAEATCSSYQCQVLRKGLAVSWLIVELVISELHTMHPSRRAAIYLVLVWQKQKGLCPLLPTQSASSEGACGIVLPFSTTSAPRLSEFWLCSETRSWFSVCSSLSDTKISVEPQGKLSLTVGTMRTLLSQKV